MQFQPDYNNVIKAARNIEVQRFPLYEHKIDPKVMERVTGKQFADLYNGDDRDLDEFFRNYCGFYRDMGYDTVSFEELIGPAMPGSAGGWVYTPPPEDMQQLYRKMHPLAW